MKKPTIYSIAKEAKLSPATISKVLNNQGGISPETARKVLAIIKKTNFQPQQRRQVYQTIGVVAFCVKNRPFLDSFSSLLFCGISQETFAAGKPLTFISSDDVENLTPEELHCYCLNHAIAGILICNIAWDHPFCQKLKSAGIPFCIVADKASDESGCASVATNNYEASVELLDYMVCLGHINIAFIGLITDQLESHRERRRAYFDVMQQHNIPLNKDFILDLPDVEMTTIKNEMTRLFARRSMPTAIFYCSEDLFKIFAILQVMNLKVPDDVSVAGFHLESDNLFYYSKISSVIQPTEELGRRCVQVLLEQIEHKTIRTEILRNKIIYGDTVKKILGGA